MKKQNRNYIFTALGLLVAFVLWTVAVSLIDVQAIGPEESTVGFATFNGLVHNLTGVNMPLYTVTDWLGLVPFGFVFGFGLLGLVQWIKRKSFLKVDYDIFVLGGFYITTMAVYVLFEILVVNYRPVLIEGVQEASYPSSTTMIVMCVMPTAIMQFNARIKSRVFRLCIALVFIAFIAFMVIGRLLSGVHWATDIIGGALLSAGLATMYYAVSRFKLK